MFDPVFDENRYTYLRISEWTGEHKNSSLMTFKCDDTSHTYMQAHTQIVPYTGCTIRIIFRTSHSWNLDLWFSAVKYLERSPSQKYSITHCSWGRVNSRLYPRSTRPIWKKRKRNSITLENIEDFSKSPITEKPGQWKMFESNHANLTQMIIISRFFKHRNTWCYSGRLHLLSILPASITKFQVKLLILMMKALRFMLTDFLPGRARKAI